MLNSLLAFTLFSSMNCLVKFSGGSSPGSTQTPSIVESKYLSNLKTNLTSRPTEKSEIRFPTNSTASIDPPSSSPSTLQQTNARLFTLNKDGQIECEEQADCPQDFVDTEDKKLVSHTCAGKICVQVVSCPSSGPAGCSELVGRHLGTLLTHSTSAAGQIFASLVATLQGQGGEHIDFCM